MPTRVSRSTEGPIPRRIILLIVALALGATACTAGGASAVPCDELTVTVVDTVQLFVDGLNRLSDDEVPTSGFVPPGVDEFRIEMLDIDELIAVSECDPVSIETAVKEGVAAQTAIAREFLDGLQVSG